MSETSEDIVVDVSKMETTTPTSEKSSAVGNAAAMREAITKCVDMIAEFGNAEIVKDPLDVIIDIDGIFKSSLSSPPRNCDRFATLDDARNAFFADYVPDETCSSATAFAIWLFDEAKGETDGSK